MAKKILGLSQNIFVLLLIVGVVIALGYGVMPTGSIFGVEQVPMTVESITAFNQGGSKITLVSNDEELKTITFRAIATVGNIGAEDLFADFSTQNIDGSLSNSVSSPKQATFTVKQVTDYYSYPIISNNVVPHEEIYNYNLSVVGWLQNCTSGTTYVIKKEFTGVLGKYCVKKVLVAKKAGVGNPNYFNSADVKMDIKQGGTTVFSKTARVNNTSLKTDEFRDSSGKFMGTVSYLGQMTSDLLQPDQTKVVAVRRLPFSSNFVKIALTDKFTDYKSKSEMLDADLKKLQSLGFTSQFSFNLLGFGFNTSCLHISCEQYLDDVISSTNNSADVLLKASDKIPYPQAITTQAFDEVTNDLSGSFKFAISGRLFQYPRLQFSVNADAIGVSLAVGKPSVVSVTPSILTKNFADSSASTIRIKVRNIGDARGTFIADLTSCNAFEIGSVTPITIEKGQEGTILLTVLPKVQQEVLNDKCVGEVYDSSKPSNKDSFSFIGNLTSQQVCLPNSFKVEGNQIHRCNSAGSEWILQETCSAGVGYDSDNNPVCKKPLLCGNGVLDVGEKCDGINLGSASCQELGYSSGTVSCTSSCQIDSSQCGGKKCGEREIFIDGACKPCAENEVVEGNKCVKPVKCEFPFIERITNVSEPTYFNLFGINLWQTGVVDKEIRECVLDPTIGMIVLLLILVVLGWFFFGRKFLKNKMKRRRR